MFGFLKLTGVAGVEKSPSFNTKILKINIDDKLERDKIVLELGRDLTLRVAQIQNIKNNRMVV